MLKHIFWSIDQLNLNKSLTTNWLVYSSCSSLFWLMVKCKFACQWSLVSWATLSRRVQKRVTCLEEEVWSSGSTLENNFAAYFRRVMLQLVCHYNTITQKHLRIIKVFFACKPPQVDFDINKRENNRKPNGGGNGGVANG